MTKAAKLWIAIATLALATLIAAAVFPEYNPWLPAGLGALLLAAIGLQGYQHRQALSGRAATYGIHAAISIVLVIGILAFLNVMAAKYPLKKDLTRDRLNELSEQTVKVVKGLKEDVQAVYWTKGDPRDQGQVLLKKYRDLSPSFKLQVSDPQRELSKALRAGIRESETLQLMINRGGKVREQKVQTPTEEKVTNALIKLLRERPLRVCSVIGHGERSMDGQDEVGYAGIKKLLNDQAYEVQEFSLAQEKKVPENCDSVVVLGPQKAFFPEEAQALEAYLDNGGRAVIALDINVKGTEFAPELLPVLAKWHVKAVNGLIIDERAFNMQLGLDVPQIGIFNRDHVITRDFGAINPGSFPAVRPLELIPGPPAGMNVQWLAQTTKAAWASLSLKDALASGTLARGPRDPSGPFNVMMSAEGKQKDSKAARNTRLVVFGTSLLAANRYARYGANADLMLNAIGWTAEDESTISIRAREENPGKLMVTPRLSSLILILSILVIPGLLMLGGVVTWVYRRKL